MQRYIRILCGPGVVVAVAILVGCQSDERPGPVHAKNLAQRSGEVLVPYEPVISHKILQDPGAFPMPAAMPSTDAAAPAEAAPAEAEPASSAPPSPDTPDSGTPVSPSGTADQPDRPVYDRGSGTGVANSDLLPPTAPAPIGGLAN